VFPSHTPSGSIDGTGVAYVIFSQRRDARVSRAFSMPSNWRLVYGNVDADVYAEN
jgi:hypothetical protein